MQYSKYCNNLAIRLAQLHDAEKALVHYVQMSAEFGELLASVKNERRDIVNQLTLAARANIDKPEEGEKNETEYYSHGHPFDGHPIPGR